LLCAGITTYNALRHSGAFPGDLVAVQGIGGLGHLGVQFASKFGYKVAPSGAALRTRRSQKSWAPMCTSTAKPQSADELQKLGGASVILATAPNSKAMSQLINAWAQRQAHVVGVAFDPIEVAPVQLITGSKSIQGWAAGTPADTEDTLRFAELSGVRPMIETFPWRERPKPTPA